MYIHKQSNRASSFFSNAIENISVVNCYWFHFFLAKCTKNCQNGAACVNNLCVCSGGWAGDLCDRGRHLKQFQHDLRWCYSLCEYMFYRLKRLWFVEGVLSATLNTRLVIGSVLREMPLARLRISCVAYESFFSSVSTHKKRTTFPVIRSTLRKCVQTIVYFTFLLWRVERKVEWIFCVVLNAAPQ